LGKKPKATDQAAASAAAKKINALLLVGALLLATGLIYYALRTPPADTRASLPKPTVATLDPAQFSGQTRQAYEAAKEVPEVLAQLPCFCGCMGSTFGHRNNLDCFHDNHGVECTMCQQIALDARKMWKSGIEIDRIREKIKEQYGKYASVTHADHAD
jgi:hypothetical protein